MSSKEKEENELNDKKNEEIEEIEKKINDSRPKSENKETTNKIIYEENQKVEKNNEDKKEVNENSRKESNIKNKRIWCVFIILTVLIIGLIFSIIFALLNLGKNTIAKGVTIKGIDVSNLTVEEATNKINEAMNVELLVGIDLKYGEEYSVDFDPTQIQYTYDIAKAVKQAYNIGKDENIVLNNYSLLKTAFLGENIELEGSYNEESLNGIVDDIASKIPGIVIQASYYIEDDELIVNKGKTGVIANKEQLRNDILNNIQNRKAIDIIENNKEQIIQIQSKQVEPEPIDLDKIYAEIHKEPKDAYYIPEPFQLFREQDGVDFGISMEEAKEIIADDSQEEYIIPLELTPASKTIDDIGTEAFPYLISSYSTKYDASNTNRSGNLKIAANKINGMVLMPDEEFSFNEVVGKRTIQEGYANAKIYENGQVVDGLAGGICQISSTLYNAVLLADLEVTERRNHSYTSTYVPAGRDATVVYGVQDFKFKNTRTYPIKLEAKVANGIAEFKIHGIKEEIEYDIRIIPVTTQTIPYQTEYVSDSSLDEDEEVVTQAGHSGCKVTTYIEKRLGGVVISKDILSNDTYNAMKTVINVGE